MMYYMATRELTEKDIDLEEVSVATAKTLIRDRIPSESSEQTLSSVEGRKCYFSFLQDQLLVDQKNNFQEPNHGDVIIFTGNRMFGVDLILDRVSTPNRKGYELLVHELKKEKFGGASFSRAS